MIKMVNLKNNLYLVMLVVTSIVLYACLLEKGLFTVDERCYLYLTKAISERLSLDCSPYFSGFPTGSNMAIPLGFFIKGSGIYSLSSFGFPLLSSPFYKLFGFYGPQIFNILLMILTTVAIFLLSRKIWENSEIAYVSSIMYLFCTFSLFYAVSLWYHSLITFCFFISTVAVFYYPERKWIPIFLISSAACIWTAYYMFVPLAVLYLFLILKLKRKLEKGFMILFLFVILSISWAYNDYVYSAPFTGYLSGEMNAGHLKETNSFTDLFHKLMNNLIRMIYGFIAMFICRACVPENLSGWVWCQKSILESSPFLIAALPGFVYLYRKGVDVKLKFIILSNLVYVLMILYGKTNTFGSWELSMRYLLPVIPLLTISASGHISKFLDYRLLYPVLLAFTVSIYLSPTLSFNSWYYYLIHMSLSLVVVLLLIWMYQRVEGTLLDVKTKKVVTAVFLLSLILLSNFININDVKIGNEVRSKTISIAEEVESLISPGALILLPRKEFYDMTEVRDRFVLYYSDRTNVLFLRDYPGGDYAASINATLHMYPKHTTMYVVIVDQGDKEIMEKFEKEHITDLDAGPPGSGLYRLKPYISCRRQLTRASYPRNLMESSPRNI